MFRAASIVSASPMSLVMAASFPRSSSPSRASSGGSLRDVPPEPRRNSGRRPIIAAVVVTLLVGAVAIALSVRNSPHDTAGNRCPKVSLRAHVELGSAVVEA